MIVPPSWTIFPQVPEGIPEGHNCKICGNTNLTNAEKKTALVWSYYERNYVWRELFLHQECWEMSGKFFAQCWWENG